MMMTTLPILGRCRRSESGTASIEFALIGTLLILLTLGVFELGRYLYTSHSLSRATGVVTRLVGMGATNEEIEASIRERLLPNQHGTLTVTFNPMTIDNLAYVQVDAQVILPLIVPGLRLLGGGDTIAVRIVQRVPAAPP